MTHLRAVMLNLGCWKSCAPLHCDVHNLLPQDLCFYHGATAPPPPSPAGQRLPHYQGFMIIPRHTTLGRTSDQPDVETSA